MLTGASVAARELDHLVVIGESGGDPDLERLLIEEMLERDVDGVVYATRTARAIRLPRGLRGVRAVLLNCEAPDERLASVVPDDEGGGRAAAAVLIAAGVDDVVVVGEDPTLEATAGPRRMAGIVAELATRGIEVADHIACDWSVPEGFEATRRWLSDGGRASGLICMNDRLAMGAYQALADCRAARARRRERGLVRRVVARRLAPACGHHRRAAVRRPRRARRTPPPRPGGPRWHCVGADGRPARGISASDVRRLRPRIAVQATPP